SRKIPNSELNRLSVEEFKQAEKSPLILVLDDIRSLNNIGSVFRTADAFLIEKIYLCGITATPPNKEIHKTALGATETVDWQSFKDIDDALLRVEDEIVESWSIEQADEGVTSNYFDVDATKKSALTFATGAKGVSENAVALTDGCIEMPQLGT